MLKMYPGWKHVTNKFTDGQPSTPKFDPLNNKLSLEADRNKPYRGLESLSSLFPADYRRRVPFTSHHDHSAVCVIPPGHKPISISRTTIDTAPATTTVDGLPLPSIALPTDNVIDTQQKLPSCVVTVGQHSVSQKELPICTKETFNSSHNSTTGQLEYHKINELDDYLGRAAEMLKLSRAAENLSDTNLSQHFSEINPELKDTKHLGNSVDFELEQNTSGDILNVSLSDDGVLQEESNRTLLNFSQKGDQNKNISLTKQLNINVVNNNGEVLNKKAQLVENVNNKDILLNKNVQFLHHGSKPAYLEQQNQETVKGDAQNFKTALDSKGGGEFDSQQQLYQKNATLIRGGDPVIPDKSIYDGGTLFETEEQSGLSERKHQKSMLDDEVHNHGNNLDGQKQIEGFERSEQNPKESYVCEDNAVRQEKIDDTDESNAQGLMGNKCEETPANENICEAEGDQLDEQYKGEEPGDGQFTEQKQWNENDQQYYQQYAEQQGDEYYQYVEGERYQQHTEIEYDQQCDEHYVNQEGEQHYQQQYADQVEGQYDQKYGNQNVEQYNQQYVDQEGLQYNQQEGQCEQQAGQYEQQEGQHDQQNIDQQYMEYQTDQYDQQYEAYEQQKQKDNQLLPESQHVSEDNQTAQCEEDNQELGNQEDTKEECDQISELIQRQRLEVKGDNQESAGDVSHTSSFEDGKYQEQMKAYQATESGVGDGSQGGGMAGAKEEKTLSEVVDDKIYGISALPKQPDISSNLTEPSSSKRK
jgi:epidermal growth factor receptor substrate 15